MKLGIMQPYFFPYIGHFSLIKATDKWVVFDTPQYQRHGWMDRNRILHPTEGWQYIKVPLVKHSQFTNVNEIKTKEPSEWQGKILRQLEHYKKRSPFYKETKAFLENAFTFSSEYLWEHNVHYLKCCCEYMDIPFDYLVTSQLGQPINAIDAGDWALRISEIVGADEYINPHGGTELFDEKRYSDAGITLRFLKNNLPSYRQRRSEFTPGLSIIDAMMFNSPEELNTLVDDYILFQKQDTSTESA